MRCNATWCLLVLVAIPGPAVGRELWVDHDSVGGRCSNSRAPEEVAEATPWCTLGVAAVQVAPGDVVHVRGGSYAEQHRCDTCAGDAVLEIVTPGETDAWIRFEAVAGETVRLLGAIDATVGVRVPAGAAYVEIVGLGLAGFETAAVLVEDASDVVLRSLEVSGCAPDAVRVVRSARVTLEQTSIRQNAIAATGAIALEDCGADVAVRANIVHSNTAAVPEEAGGDGIWVRCLAGGVIVENNVVHGNDGACVRVEPSSAVVVRNNTCWQNARGAGAGELVLGGGGLRVHNNVVVSRDDRRALQLELGLGVDRSTIAEGHDLFWSESGAVQIGWLDRVGALDEFQQENPGWGAGSLAAEPRVRSWQDRDFHLAEGSPGIDSGDADEAAALDADERSRPLDGDGDGDATVDRGAYERSSDDDEPDEDAGVPAGDAGATPEAGSAPDEDAGALGGRHASSGSGCGCAVVSDDGSVPEGLAVLVAAISMRARRRRPRARSGDAG